jgi:uncharacterized repeat protein (TIGR01451 family)
VEDIPNFNSTGRELIRVTFPGSAFTSGFDTVTAPANFVELTVPTAATTYNNTAQLFVSGIGTATQPSCGPGTTSTPSTFESSDPLNLAADGLSNEDYCQWAASLTVPPTGGPGFTLLKTVQGDLDSGPKYGGGIGHASPAGSGTYTLQWSNTGGKNLTNPVVYDILPYIGDTGVTEGQATTARDSQFAPTFTAISGALPSGVTVAYSLSTNPCRSEVYPDADNPTCTNDWTTTPPSDPSQVKALRFTATGTYTPGQSFTVALMVAVPAGYVNTVAWNSAASDADYNGSPLLPAEPPKVGLTAPAAPVTPTVSTSASATDVQPGDSFGDAVVVGHTGGASGTLGWSLLGPLTPAPDGTCRGLDWASAPTVDQGTLPVTGNGTYATPTSAPTGAGCYGYTEQLSGSSFASTVTSDAGASGETVLVHAATLSTTASTARSLPGAAVTDAIRIGGTGTGAGTIKWKLVGPAAPAPDGTCRDLDWSGAPSFANGTIDVTGDGTYTTDPATPTAAGCYSYSELLTTGSVGGPAMSAPGTAAETFLVAQPTLSTTVSARSVTTGTTVSDVVNVDGTPGQPGNVSWQLMGPVAADAAGDCGSANWTASNVVAQGSFPVTGDGQYVTPATAVSADGCYAYRETLAGDAYGGAVTSPAGAPGEVLLATSPLTRAANLSIVKRVNTTRATVGQLLHYTLIVTNRGPGAARAVTVTDTPAVRMRLLSATTPHGHCGHALPLTCTLGTLPAQRHVTITVRAVPLSAGIIVNHAHVTTSTPNSAPAAAVAGAARTRVLIPLTLTKTASRSTVVAGGRLSYAVDIANRTPVTAHRVTACDQLPAGLVFVSASVPTRLRGGRLCWTVATIPAHGREVFTLSVRALAGARGRLTNVASISGATVDPRRASAAVQVMPLAARPTGVTG